MATRGDDYEVRDEDRLPWLESAEDDYEEGPSIQRIALLVGIGLALIAAAIFGIYWFKNREAGGPAGDGTLIAAPEGDYKVKPDEPGGMKVEGEGEAALAASAGAAGNTVAAIDLDSVPEAPVTGQKAGPSAAPAVVAGKTVAVPASGGTLKAGTPGAPAAKPAPVASAGGTVQLGSYPSEAGANAEWAALSKRFGYLAGLTKSIQQAEVNGKTYYRLRVAAGDAAAASTLCGKLKVAGEDCIIAR